MNKIYVTFTYPRQFVNQSRIAVECSSMEQAEKVAHDACGIAGMKNVRIRAKTIPRDRRIVPYEVFCDWV